MPEEALGTGQVGQPAPQEPQAGNAIQTDATFPEGGQSAPETEQPLSLTKSQLEKYISDALNGVKQDWLNESYQNAQSMNDKFEKRVNDTIAQFEKAGIKTDKVSAAKFLRSQDQAAASQANAQRQSQQAISPEYQQFLQRFGVQPSRAGDQRLSGAYSLEREYGVQLMREDPEYAEYFGDPKKSFSAYQFQRDYEKALQKKKERMTTNGQANAAGMPSLSGKGRQSNAIPNTMNHGDILDQGLAELRNR